MTTLLRTENIPFVALDLDPNCIKQAWEDGDNVFYGDARHKVILEAAGLNKARALVVSFDDAPSALTIIQQARSQRSSEELPILVRVEDDSQLELLSDAGATQVIPETLKAGLILVMQLLLTLGLSTETLVERMRAIKQGCYGTGGA